MVIGALVRRAGLGVILRQSWRLTVMVHGSAKAVAYPEEDSGGVVA
jgi:hypothetical protein